MSGDDLADSEPEDDDLNPAEAAHPDPDTISDWPADAIPSEPEEPAWSPGGVLGYAQQHRRRLPGRRRPSSVSPNVGPIAQWSGVCGIVGILGLIGAGILVEATKNTRVAAIALGSINVLLLLGGLGTLAALILGTIGRLNDEGRRAATIGRRLGCAGPISVFAAAFLAAVAAGNGMGVLGATAALVFILIIGSLIILVVDAILGTS